VNRILNGLYPTFPGTPSETGHPSPKNVTARSQELRNAAWGFSPNHLRMKKFS